MSEQASPAHAAGPKSLDAPDGGQWGISSGAGLVFRTEYGGIACAFCDKPTTASEAWAYTNTTDHPVEPANVFWKFTSNADLASHVPEARNLAETRMYVSAVGVMTNCAARYWGSYSPTFYLNQALYSNALVPINTYWDAAAQKTKVRPIPVRDLYLNSDNFGDAWQCPNVQGSKTGWDAVQYWW